MWTEQSFDVEMQVEYQSPSPLSQGGMFSEVGQYYHTHKATPRRQSIGEALNNSLTPALSPATRRDGMASSSSVSGVFLSLSHAHPSKQHAHTRAHIYTHTLEKQMLCLNPMECMAYGCLHIMGSIHYRKSATNVMFNKRRASQGLVIAYPSVDRKNVSKKHIRSLSIHNTTVYSILESPNFQELKVIPPSGRYHYQILHSKHCRAFGYKLEKYSFQGEVGRQTDVAGS